MVVSAGNLDPLLGALAPAADLYSLHVDSYTTTGTGTSERIASITATVGNADSFESTPITPTSEFTVSAFDDALGTATFTPGIGIDPDASLYSPTYLFGFSSTALLMSSLPSFNIALGLDFNISQDVSLGIFSEQPLTNGTVITFSATGAYTDSLVLVCYCAGTQIATPAGEVAVERLVVGDMVTTLRGEARCIVWIGSGRVLATRGRRTAATPVIVRRSALADNVPRRDLRLTKGHSLYIDGVLIPVEFLVNHRSICWDDRAQEVEIYHIELDTHDVLLADGAPAESYHDDGNRWLFRNANIGWCQLPREPCAPILTGGPVVDAIWQRLLDRAGPRKGSPLTTDTDLHLLADGQRMDAIDRIGETHIFRLPRVPSALRIVSRAAAPAELGLARDPRTLGVALRQLVVRQGRRLGVIEAMDDRLTDGFHAFEPDNGFRWTDGDAAVPQSLLAGCAGPVELTLQVACSTRYIDDGMEHQAA